MPWKKCPTFCRVGKSYCYRDSMANGRTSGDDIMWLYDDIKQMIFCNVFSDHPVRLNPTCWVIKIPNRRSHVPFFLLQGLVLCAGHCTYSLGERKRRQALQTLVDPPITCCACISSPWGGSIDVRKRVRRCGDVRWKTTRRSRHGQYIWLSGRGVGGGKWKKKKKFEKEKLIFPISEAIQFV